MDVDSQDTSNQVNDHGSQENQDQEQQIQEQQSSEEVVSKAELKKVLDQMHEYKKKARELEGQIKNTEIEKMKEKEEWEKIAKLKEEEAEKYRTESQSLKESFLNNRKFDAIKQVALANGIRQEALQDLELWNFDDDVAIETTSTGKINVLGAENAIKKLKASRPYWFGKSMGNVNADSPNVVSGEEMTVQKLSEIQKEARKSGSWGKYEQALKQYKASKQ